MINVDEHVKQIVDVISITTIFGTLMGILPSVAAVLSLVWSLVRLYETRTVRGIISKLKGNSDANS